MGGDVTKDLMDEYIATLDAELEWLDGMQMSEQELAEKYIGGFLAWLNSRKATMKGCRKSLAPGQYWRFCGETDMGQTAPALCTECGGELKLA